MYRVTMVVCYKLLIQGRMVVECLCQTSMVTLYKISLSQSHLGSFPSRKHGRNCIKSAGAAEGEEATFAEDAEEGGEISAGAEVSRPEVEGASTGAAGAGETSEEVGGAAETLEAAGATLGAVAATPGAAAETLGAAGATLEAVEATLEAAVETLGAAGATSEAAAEEEGSRTAEVAAAALGEAALATEAAAVAVEAATMTGSPGSEFSVYSDSQSYLTLLKISFVLKYEIGMQIVHFRKP